LSASIVFGFTNTFSKLVIHKHDGKLVADVRLVVSGLALAIVGLAVAGNQVLVTSAGLWPLAAGLCFWLGIRTFYGSVHHLSPNKAFVLNNSQLFFTAVIGVLVLSEPYGWSTFIGSVIVLASIYFITKK
jgi:drug/metabolite transporter (DMT)-like permease